MGIETSLVADYENIRRKQYSLLTDMINVLPRINNLQENYVVQARDALFHADHPFLMVFVGPFSAGKSSLINALMGQKTLLEVGPVPTTDRISILRWGEEPQRMDSGGDVDTVFYPSPLLKKVSFVDTPGLESVFKQHEETTRKFLHRSDVVLLVMLATQAMTSRNLEYLQTLREYGKKVILIINQVDLLTPEEAETVKNYVQDQSLDRLGYKPQVWLMSSKLAGAATVDGVRDEAAWKASGLHQLEAYIDQQLGDVERLRQKLQTPLQIAQNVNTTALRIVRGNQSVLDQYQAISENVDQQLASHRREQAKILRETNQEISDRFGEATQRGSEAIREIFQLSQALTSVWRGLMELTGLARVLRRGGDPSYVRAAFDKHKTFEPILLLPSIVDRLAPRLEGRDVQDVDDLVKYAQREIKALPETIREKVIGTVHAPVQYDRRALLAVRPELEKIEDEARVIETDSITQSVRNALLYLGMWEFLIIVTGIIVLVIGLAGDNPQNVIAVILLMLGLAILGGLTLPLTGRLIENRYTDRLLKLQAQYIETLSKATEAQIDYGMRLRHDAIAPLTRLVEAQTQIQTEQLNRLQSVEQEMTTIETELNKLGKRNFLGIGR